MIIEILVVLALILVQGVFAMGEMAIVASRRARLKSRAEHGDKGAAAALALAESPSRFFSTVQIGLTLTNILAGAVGGTKISARLLAIFSQYPVVAPYAEALAIGIVVVAITIVTLLFGELLPKRLAVSRPEEIASAVGRGMSWMARATAPLVWFLSVITDLCMRLVPRSSVDDPKVTDEEIKLLMQQGTDAGNFHPSEKSIVDMALRLGDRRVSALMTPRTQVEWLDLKDPVDENKQKIRESHYSRFPVAEGGRRHIVGVVEVKDLLGAELAGKGFDIRSAMKPAIYIPESAPALKALETFRETGAPIALIVDEYGDFQGVVTLEDLLESLVGELPSPGQDEEPLVTKRADGSWLVDGMMPIDELRDAVGITALPAEEDRTYQTVAGLVMDQLRRIPKTADRFDIANFRFEVVDMDGRRVDKVMVSKKPELAESDMESSAA